MYLPFIFAIYVPFVLLIYIYFLCSVNENIPKTIKSFLQSIENCFSSLKNRKEYMTDLVYTII